VVAERIEDQVDLVEKAKALMRINRLPKPIETFFNLPQAIMDHRKISDL
jgi:hypothetical protein